MKLGFALLMVGFWLSACSSSKESSSPLRHTAMADQGQEGHAGDIVAADFMGYAYDLLTEMTRREIARGLSPNWCQQLTFQETRRPQEFPSQPQLHRYIAEGSAISRDPSKTQGPGIPTQEMVKTCHAHSLLLSSRIHSVSSDLLGGESWKWDSKVIPLPVLLLDRDRAVKERDEYFHTVISEMLSKTFGLNQDLPLLSSLKRQWRRNLLTESQISREEAFTEAGFRNHAMLGVNYLETCFFRTSLAFPVATGSPLINPGIISRLVDLIKHVKISPSSSILIAEDTKYEVDAIGFAAEDGNWEIVLSQKRIPESYLNSTAYTRFTLHEFFHPLMLQMGDQSYSQSTILDTCL